MTKDEKLELLSEVDRQMWVLLAKAMRDPQNYLATVPKDALGVLELVGILRERIDDYQSE